MQVREENEAQVPTRTGSPHAVTASSEERPSTVLMHTGKGKKNDSENSLDNGSAGKARLPCIVSSIATKLPVSLSQQPHVNWRSVESSWGRWKPWLQDRWKRLC